MSALPLDAHMALHCSKVKKNASAQVGRSNEIP
jgi:hypothetical protein